MSYSILLLALTIPLSAVDFPPPKKLTPEDRAGIGIQRTMGLLAGSTPEKRNTVRILFYGQSITEQAWAGAVSEHLRSTYPNANLIIENRAIGGHASQLLVKTAEADLVPFQPDLLIFHVYGAHDKYEDLIQMVRQNTVAEILIQSDHLGGDQSIDEETDPSDLDPSKWAQWFNYKFLPFIAEKYDAELIPQRDLWKQYLRDYRLTPKDLLKDNVHLNAHGEYLMGEIVKNHLRHHPEVTPAAAERVRTTKMEDLKFQNGELVFPFDGNRIDAILAKKGGETDVEVFIDGKAPSAFPEAYAFTRVTGYNRTNWPILLRVHRGETAVVPESWTITLRDAAEDYSSFKFSIEGSVTGPDGEGNSDEAFSSKSGRIRIDPQDWNLRKSKEVFKVIHPTDVPIGFDVVPLHVDTFNVKSGEDPSKETALTLVQNLPAGSHTLTLRTKSETPPPITALRVYQP